MKHRRLDIGGGTQPRDPERFTSVDVHGAPDVRANLWELPFSNESIEEIWSSHTLEHVPSNRVVPALREWFRVLCPGGRAIVSVPNFDYVAKYWLTGPDREWAHALVFGLQRDEGDFHRCAFTPALLRGDCEAAGFQVKNLAHEWSYTQETIKAVCVKPRLPPVLPSPQKEIA